MKFGRYKKFGFKMCFVKGFDQICHKICSFCMDESEQNEAKGYAHEGPFSYQPSKLRKHFIKNCRQFSRIIQYSAKLSNLS